MRKPGFLRILACLVGLSASHCILGTSHVADPEDGRVTNGAYTNAYFGVSYPLPPGWVEDVAGPAPSQTGYYVLGSLKSKGEPSGTILIAAQDLFFTAKPLGDMLTMARDFRDAMSQLPAMTIDREPSQTVVDGRRIVRVDYSGVGLHRAMIATTIRCHVVTFNLTTREPTMLASLARDVVLSVAVAPNIESSAPACIKDYATADNVVTKVEPVPAGPRYVPIPVRITIAADGTVKHIHVISATTEQIRSIADALEKWKFEPRRIDGRPVETETGLAFQFTSTSSN
jgi:Gram-negative bacterial TonB protein C-terminal